MTVGSKHILRTDGGFVDEFVSDVRTVTPTENSWLWDRIVTLISRSIRLENDHVGSLLFSTNNLLETKY
jgi:hypothetical protein